jgi:hypothetical protein
MELSASRFAARLLNAHYRPRTHVADLPTVVSLSQFGFPMSEPFQSDWRQWLSHERKHEGALGESFRDLLAAENNLLEEWYEEIDRKQAANPETPEQESLRRHQEMVRSQEAMNAEWAAQRKAAEAKEEEAALPERRSSRVRTNNLKICRCELCRPGKYVTPKTFLSHHASVMGEVGPQQAERMAADDTELGRVLLAAQAHIIEAYHPEFGTTSSSTIVKKS